MFTRCLTKFGLNMQMEPFSGVNFEFRCRIVQLAPMHYSQIITRKRNTRPKVCGPLDIRGLYLFSLQSSVQPTLLLFSLVCHLIRVIL